MRYHPHSVFSRSPSVPSDLGSDLPFDSFSSQFSLQSLNIPSRRWTCTPTAGQRSEVHSGNATVRMSRASALPDGGSDKEAWVGRGPAFTASSKCNQLLAVMDRKVKQLLRRKFFFMLDIVIPLLFVVSTVLIWRVWGTNNMEEVTYVAYRRGASLFSPSYYKSAHCFNTSLPPVPTLKPCYKLERFTCGGDGALLPFPPNSICSHAGNSFERTIAVFLANTMAKIVEVPSLDLIIFHQWLGILAYRDSLQMLAEGPFVGQAPTTRYNSLMCSGNLYFVGDTALMRRMVAYFNRTSDLFQYVYSPGSIYSTMAKARKAVPKGGRVWAIIEVRSMSPTDFDAVIHMDGAALPPLGSTFNTAYPGGFQYDTAELYLVSGFCTLQNMVSSFYTSFVLGAKLQLSHFMAPMGTPPFQRTPILEQSRRLLPLILALMYLYSVTQQTQKTVQQRELKLHELMLIMGLDQWPLYLSDLLLQTMVSIVVSVLSVLFLRDSYVTKSDPMVLFLVFFLYSLTTIPLSGLIASFLSKSRLVSLIAPAVFITLLVPMTVMPNASSAAICGFAIFPPCAFAAVLNILLAHENGIGFTASDFNNSQDNPTMAVLLSILFADFIIYYILMLYVDAVLPREWGTPRHPLFFVLEPIAWCVGPKPKKLVGGDDGRAPNGVFESSDHWADAVQIKGLRKTYRRGGVQFAAVNNFYWGLREGEISVLLGHNGAGKTTVLNMMNGMIEPDEGDCYVYGMSTRTQRSLVRREIGFCPQQNVLWPELTCRDHLEFYGRIKGLRGRVLEEAVWYQLHDMRLLDKIDQPVASLSGGMKRKLSICIAFVGGSHLVFLDEPTVGLDAGTRRHVWDLLKRLAQFRTILLTTHYMDEADLLGNRIGIMSQGRLMCSGSALYLKSRMGLGYCLTISVAPHANSEHIDSFVTSAVDNSDVLGHKGLELTYRIPALKVDQFPQLLNLIECEGKEMGIRGYSFSGTTLQEIFLRVSEVDCEGRNDAVAAADEINVVWSCTYLKSRIGSQFRATRLKRFRNSLRDRQMQCYQLLCPVTCLLIALVFNLVRAKNPDELPMDYTMLKGFPEITVITANCDQLWGNNSVGSGAIIQNTLLSDALSLSNFLLDEWYQHSDARFGAFACVDLTMYSSYVNSYPLLANPNIMLYNTSSRHQAGINMAMFYEQFVSYITNGRATFKWTAKTFEQRLVTDPISYIFISTLTIIPFTFLPLNPVSWVVKERACGARHLQDIAGLNYYVYWFCNFLFDIIAYSASISLCLLLFGLFGRNELIGEDRIVATLALLALFGVTSTVAAYSLSFAFSNYSTAQTVVVAVNFVSGFLMLMIVSILKMREDSVDYAENLRWFFRLFPSYTLCDGMMNLLQLDLNIASGHATTLWSMDQLGWSLVYLSCEFLLFTFVTLFMDHPARRRFIQRLLYNRDSIPELSTDVDSDVEDARAAVLEAERNGDSTDVVRLVNLQKRYENGKFAVKGSSFSIVPGKVFGLLGTNGAGKTTTITMLCQLLMPTGGCATVCGYDVVFEGDAALSCIGYCPQFDATLDLLSVEEHIYLYCAIRGIVPEEHTAVCEALLTLCELKTYRKALALNLSGGNRRKLSFAVSLVGGPRVVLLDEPSAGMDPVARCGMWTAVQCAARHCAVVLTTHHLEEVEAIADVVAIMVDGELRCIGDKVHLKNKFGTGFELSMRVLTPEYLEPTMQFIEAEMPGASLLESGEQNCVYQIPRGVTFGCVLQRLQEQREWLCITDYSISQTSIERVFLNVTEGK